MRICAILPVSGTCVDIIDMAAFIHLVKIHKVCWCLCRVVEITHEVFTVRCVPVVSMATHHSVHQTVATRVLVRWVFRQIHLPRVAERFQDPCLATYVSARKVMKDVPVNGEPAWLCELLLLQPFYDPLSRTTRVSRYQKNKPFWILLKQSMVVRSKGFIV